MLALLGRKGAEKEAIIEGVNGGNTVEERSARGYFWCERCPPSNTLGDKTALNRDFIVP